MKKNIVFISISLGLIILLGIGVSYSLWNISVSQDTTNMAESKCFDLSISNQENNINLDNAYPISNDKGKSLTPYTFTITNTCDITTEYSVNLEVLNNSTLSSKFIDVMFEGNINLLSSYDNTDKLNTSSIESRKLTTGILKSGESKNYSLRLWIDYNTTLEDLNNEIKSFKSKIVVVGKPINYTGDTVFNFDYTGAEQTFIAPVSGTYKVELWGASGGSDYPEVKASLGGYVSGNIALDSHSDLYIYVGESPSYGSMSCYDSNPNSAFNSSHFGSCAVGGGGTDVRIISGIDWDDFDSLKSRIMVASGGGGGIYSGNGGAGGGLIGYTGIGFNSTVKYTVGVGGTQKSSYFGKSLRATTIGGGGYYAGNPGYGANSGGGSSFISGHNGCDAIKEESTEDNIIHTGQSIHYSGLYFADTVMIDGEGYRWTDKKEEYVGMPSHLDNSIITGNTGNGYARITLISIDE